MEDEAINKHIWISIVDRFPAPYVNVLAYFSYSNKLTHVVSNATEMAYYRWGKWHVNLQGVKDIPSHWMPLPKPPEI